ncbi:MAG: RecQ family ATP-dependent DNA helicase [Prevotella sp.]|nr:RecQ family ATP-dependent DNA helicase [Prevotella sp.]
MYKSEDILKEILHKYWGYEDFRGIQREIIESIYSGRDTLGLMPTGGGKSITFQVPAIAKNGVCLVITPLVALMKDQVVNLRSHGIKAAAIHSSMSHAEILTTLENAVFGGIKILYVSPERLSSELFLKKLSHMNVSFITVDEAHCISQWGYDFRPSYLKINEIRNIKPEAPILALTATATTRVIDDIQVRLGFKEKNVFRMSYERKNLAYIVKKSPDKQAEVLRILKSVNGSAIIYVRSRRRSREISELLNDNNVSATFYNAGLEDAARDERQNQWHAGKIRVMVATNAFGMGIDKPDVRIVIHLDCPDSLEAYFQEAGRAGRDGKNSYAIMLYNNNDKSKLERRIAENYPEKDYIRQVYEHLAYFYQIGMGSGAGCRFEFNIDRFCQAFKHFPIQVDSSLSILTKAGYIQYEDESDSRARIKMLLTRDSLYRLDSLTTHENAVVTSLLRNYGGLFSDYSYIDESLIALQSGLAMPELYVLLKGLSERRIIHFIPRKMIPHISYTQRREEAERLVFPPDIYDDRKKEYIERIQAVLSYATNDAECRSRQLLRYFGELKSSDCNQCDVCLSHKKKETPKEFLQTAQMLIKNLLADNKPHIVTDIDKIDYKREILEEALEYLISEEDIKVHNGQLLMESVKR